MGADEIKRHMNRRPGCQRIGFGERELRLASQEASRTLAACRMGDLT